MEGGCEMNTRIPEMNPKLERCLLALTWPGEVCDNRSPVLGLPWEKGLRAGAWTCRWPCLSNPLSGQEGSRKTQGQEVESPSPSPGLPPVPNAPEGGWGHTEGLQALSSSCLMVSLLGVPKSKQPLSWGARVRCPRAP